MFSVMTHEIDYVTGCMDRWTYYTKLSECLYHIFICTTKGRTNVFWPMVLLVCKLSVPSRILAALQHNPSVGVGDLAALGDLGMI